MIMIGQRARWARNNLLKRNILLGDKADGINGPDQAKILLDFASSRTNIQNWIVDILCLLFVLPKHNEHFEKAQARYFFRS